MQSKNIFRGLSFYRINIRIIWTELKMVLIVVDEVSFEKMLHTRALDCSKLMMSLVNISLKFQTLISNICPVCFVEKMREAFTMQKLLSFFLNKKYQCVWLQSGKTLNKSTC